MSEWITRADALAQLAVKPQTLYAYASRGLIEAKPHPDHGRTSLYRADDVFALAERKRRGRKPRTIAASSLSWGEPSIETSVSTIVRGRLIYAGKDAVDLAQTHAVEQVARLLWSAPIDVHFTIPVARAPNPFAGLAALAATAPPMLGRGRARLTGDAQAAIGDLAAALALPAGGQPLHLVFARHWRLSGDAAEAVRAALVLMADHDLNASTFACRVAASTGASMAAALLAGLCALSGPLHGGASAALARLISESEQGDAEATVRHWLDTHGQLPGFGHPLYPQGDARALALLDRVSPDDAMKALAAAVFDQAGLLPNIDFALTVLMRTLDLPGDAPFTLFLLGRSIGWAAHAMEQAGSRQLIRPRGIYTGPLPVA